MRARYSRWDATQDPLGGDLDLGRLLDEMSEGLLSGFGANDALQHLQRRGLEGLRGLDEIREQLRRRRGEMAQRLNVSGPLDEVRDELAHILSLERSALDQTPGDEARLREAMLDALPRHPAGALKELATYDFASPEAQARFNNLVERLRQEVMNAYFSQLSGAMRDLSENDLARMKDMLAELNAMVQARAADQPYDFDGFMSRYGDMWPENPRSLDELLEVMARRMAAMSRLLASMTPQQRDELSTLASSVLGDLDLAFQVDQLSRSLRDLLPELPWDESISAWGDDQMPMSQTLEAIERMSELEELDDTLTGDYAGATLEDVDEDSLRRALGDDAVRDLRRLKEIEKALEEAGIVQRARGRIELTARGARLLGERGLDRVLTNIRKEPSHRARGGQAEPTGQTSRWTFGSADPISVERTVYNAVARSGPGRSVSLVTDDFEVIETESRPKTATALLLDLSFSMPLGGHWVPAKRMALALDSLIEGKYPDDVLHLIGFSDYAREMKATDLASAGWEEVHGTNMQHAFLLARRLLSEDRCPVKQIIMVTDGEPTAHLQEDGYALFNWPPIPITIEKTLREAARCARSGIAINVFMLEDSPGLIAFMDKLTRLTGGEVFAAHSGELSDRIVGGYMARSNRWGPGIGSGS